MSLWSESGVLNKGDTQCAEQGASRIKNHWASDSKVHNQGKSLGIIFNADFNKHINPVVRKKQCETESFLSFK